MRAACYVRVSTDEQRKNGISVDDQIFTLQKFCEENGYEVSGVYNDAGISARKSFKKRPALLQLLRDCEDKKIDIVLFTRLDRWFRSVSDYYEVQAVLDRCGVPWNAILEDYETVTSSGVFKVNIMLSIAQAEADRTSEKIKSVMAYKKAKGEYNGHIPYGYIRENGKLYIDESKRETIETLYKTYLETHSTSCALRAAQRLDNTLTETKAKRVLWKAPFYYGDAWGAPCEAYITIEQHEELVRIKDGNIKCKKGGVHPRIFAGLLVCGECGGKMWSSGSFNKHVYLNYVCSGIRFGAKHEKAVSVASKRLEKYLLENLEKSLDEWNASADVVQVESINKVRAEEKKALEKRLERIGMRFEEGDITAEEYKKKRTEVLQKIASIRFLSVSKKIELPSNWKELYTSLSEESQHIFWTQIIDHIVIYRNWSKSPEIHFK